jgi:hypothetical protein
VRVDGTAGAAAEPTAIDTSSGKHSADRHT